MNIERIAKTGFFISLFSYVVFWLMDALRPGFVARSFSVHVFLLCAIGFGVWWGVKVQSYTDRPWVQMLTAGGFGFILAVITWRLGSGFDLFRPLMTLVALCVPWVVWLLIRR